MEQTCGLEQAGQRVSVLPELELDLAERTQGLREAFGMTRTPAELNRLLVGLDRGVDASLLQLNVRDRGQVKLSAGWSRPSLPTAETYGGPLKTHPLEGVPMTRRLLHIAVGVTGSG